MRFSLRTILLVTTALAVVLMSLRQSSELVASLWSTTAVLATMASLVAVIHCAPTKRPFWFGYLLFSVAYLLLMTGSIAHVGIDAGSTETRQYVPSLRTVYRLLAPKATTALFVAFHKEHGVDVDFGTVQWMLQGDWGEAGEESFNRSLANFWQMAHGIWMITLGVAGGLIATSFARRGRMAAPSPDERSPFT